MVGLGLFGGLFAFYWPLERTDLPSLMATVVYLLGAGVLAVFGQVVLERVEVVPKPPGWVLWGDAGFGRTPLAGAGGH